jgi:hypothetical protein
VPSICLRREHLRRTMRIALVVGVVSTLINQADVIIRGDATAVTGVKVVLSFCVPFVVSNFGLLAAKRGEGAVGGMTRSARGGRRS